MITALNALLYMLLSSAFLGPVVWATWKFILHKMFPGLPDLSWFDASMLLLVIQAVPYFTVRRVEVRYIPTFLPMPSAQELEAENDKK